MKPSWNDAPEWANYLVINRDGGWSWFESKPSYLVKAGLWFCDKGQSISAIATDEITPACSIEERP